MRYTEDDPLAHGIQEDAHEQEVRHGLEAGPHQLAPQAATSSWSSLWRVPSCSVRPSLAPSG